MPAEHSSGGDPPGAQALPRSAPGVRWAGLAPEQLEGACRVAAAAVFGGHRDILPHACVVRSTLY